MSSEHNNIIREFNFESLPLPFSAQRHIQVYEDVIYYNDTKLFGNNNSYGKIRVDRIYDAYIMHYESNKRHILLLLLFFFAFIKLNNAILFFISVYFLCRLILFKKYFIKLEMENGSYFVINFYTWEEDICHEIYDSIDYMLDKRVDDTNIGRYINK